MKIIHLNKFRVKLDTILETIWQEFEKSDWEVKHRIKATNKSDEDFSRQYTLIIKNKK